MPGQRDIETQRLVTPNPVTQGREAKKVDADCALWVVAWLLFSAGFIIYNKWVFTSGGFPYPWALTCMHMTSCFVIFGIIRNFAPNRFRLAVMPDADVVAPWSVYVKQFLSISVLYAATLGTGQMAQLHGTVSFVQMMKPMNCIFASVAAFLLGAEVATTSHMIIVGIITFGVMFAAHGAAEQFSMAAALLQIFSSVTEGFRLSLLQVATTTGMKLDPVSTVYYFSFGSAVLLACVSFSIEWPLDLSKLLSPWVLVVNCLMAVILNVLVATVIKKTSAVVFTLSGVVKDMGVVVAASFLFVTPLKRMAVCGYSISLAGLFMYKIYKDNLELFLKRGFFDGMRVALSPPGKNPKLGQLPVAGIVQDE